MTTIRRIVTSQVDGNSANTDNDNEIRPFGETAIYIDNNGPTDKPVLSIHDGIRTHLRSKVLGPGVLYGSNADAGDDSGADTIKLIPDALLYDQGSNQYIVVDPTGGEPGHIHLRAGGTQDASSADLYLGGELTCVRVSDTSGTVTVRTTNIGDPNVTLDWSFQQDGNLYFPGIGNTRIGESEPGLVVSSDASVVLQSNNNGESKELTFGTDGSLTTPGGYIKPDATDGFLTIEGPLYADMVQEEGGGVRTITNGVKIRTHRAFDDVNHDWNFSWDGAIYAPRDASNYQVGAIEWRTDNVTSQVRRTEGGTLLSGRVVPPGLMLFSNGTGAVSVLTGNSKYWTFEEDGDLTIPGGIRSDGDINIDINLSDSTLRRWRFGEDGHLNLAGNLTFPDATVQTTALKAETIAQVGYRLQFDTDIYANSTGGATSSNETGVQFASNTVVRELFDLTPPATSTAARAYVDPAATEGQPDPNILEVTIVSGAPISVGMIVFAIVNGTPTFLGPIDSQTDATTFRIMGAPLTEEIPIGTEFEFYGPGNFIEYAPINPITIFWDSGEETVVTAGSTNDPYGVNVFLVTAEDQTALTYPIEVATDNYAPAEFSHVIDADNDFKITTKANDFIINSNEGPLIIRNATSDYIFEGGTLTVPGTINIDGVGSVVGFATGPDNFIGLEGQANWGVALRATDSELDSKNWLFGTNGVLTLPGEGVIRSNNDTVILQSYDTTFNVGKGIRIGTNGHVFFELGDDPAYFQIGENLGNASLTAGADLNIVAGGGSSPKTWEFGTDGSLTFPDSTVQETAWAGGRVVAVPTSSLGTTGDLAGDLAFNATYMYYCTQNFAGTVINMNSITSSGILRAYIIMYDSNTGWTSADLTGYTVTGPGSYTGTVTGPSQDQGGGLWYIPVSPDVTQAMGTYTFTSPGGDIWKRIAWSGDTW